MEEGKGCERVRLEEGKGCERVRLEEGKGVREMEGGLRKGKAIPSASYEPHPLTNSLTPPSLL